jgi:hypothetical protein
MKNGACVKDCGKGYKERGGYCKKKSSMKKDAVKKKQMEEDKKDGIKRNYKRQ